MIVLECNTELPVVVCGLCKKVEVLGEQSFDSFELRRRNGSSSAAQSYRVLPRGCLPEVCWLGTPDAFNWSLVLQATVFGTSGG